MPQPDIEAIAEQVFVALADPSRRAILATLASGGPATATDLAGQLPITRQAVAKHLGLLAEPPGRRSIFASLPNQALSPSGVVSAAHTLAGG